MISCQDRCGASVADEMAAQQAAWTYLSITGRYRCTDCRRALAAAATMRGTDDETPDTLPRDSRGALPKETASTITPPVKGLQ